MARYCDGWIPIDILIKDLPTQIADVRRRAAAHGRNPDDIEISVFAFEGASPDALKAYRDMGVKRVALITPRRLEDALRSMDNLAELIPQVA